MFLIMVASIFVSLQNVEGVYDYQRPDNSLDLSNNKVGIQGFPSKILNEYKNLDDKKITYSWPDRDYNFLQQHKFGGNGHYFPNTYRDFTSSMPIVSKWNINTAQRFIANIPNTVYGSPKVGQSKTLIHHQVPLERYQQNSEFQTKKFINNVQKALPGLVPYLMNANLNVASPLNFQNPEVQHVLPPKVNFLPQPDVHYKKPPIFYNPQSISNLLETHDQNLKPVENLHNLQFDFVSQKTYNPQVDVNINPSLKLAQPSGGQDSVSPVITKHIYFHAPPPDIEEAPLKPTPPKKSYKIIFIKVPSQESKNIEKFKTYNKLGSIEDKTLIYVLSNNSKESSQLGIPSYKPSDHEVLFVKYNGNHSIGSDGDLLEHDDAIYQRKR